MTLRHRKKADVRFYIDADLLGLAKVLTTVRVDVTFPGDPGGVLYKALRPPCPIASSDVRDVDWLPVVAANNWLIITRDSRINDHTAEIAAVRKYAARLITLSSVEATSKFNQLEIVMCRWREIEQRANEPGPFIYRATRTKMTSVDLGK